MHGINRYLIIVQHSQGFIQEGGETWEILPNLSSPPKILTCCHDLVMYNIILSHETNGFQQHTKAFEIALLADACTPSPPTKNPV